jgi:hypothetical protein
VADTSGRGRRGYGQHCPHLRFGITQNGTGISVIAGGQIITFRTNMLAGNSTGGSTPFSISLK